MAPVVAAPIEKYGRPGREPLSSSHLQGALPIPVRFLSGPRGSSDRAEDHEQAHAGRGQGAAAEEEGAAAAAGRLLRGGLCGAGDAELVVGRGGEERAAVADLDAAPDGDRGAGLDQPLPVLELDGLPAEQPRDPALDPGQQVVGGGADALLRAAHYALQGEVDAV